MSSPERKMVSALDGRASSTSLRVDEPDLAGSGGGQQREKQIVANLSSSSDIEAMKARARKSRILGVGNSLKPGAISVRDADEGPHPSSLADNGDRPLEDHSSSSSISSSTEAMKARARRFRIRNAGVPLTPGAVCAHDGDGGEHTNNDDIVKENSALSHATSVNLGVFEVKDRNEKLGGEEINLGHAPGLTCTPVCEHPDSYAKTARGTSPFLPGAVASTDEMQSKGKGGNSEWMDPLGEPSNRNLIPEAAPNRENDAYSQFAHTPEFVRLSDSSRNLKETPIKSTSTRSDGDATINAPVRHFSEWLRDSEAMSLRTKARINPKLCIVGAIVLVGIVVAVAVVVGLAVSGGGDADKSDPAPSPVFVPTLTPTRIVPDCVGGDDHSERFLQITEILGYSDPGAARRETMCWLADSDELQVEPTDGEKLQQRFALAVLYFSTTPDETGGLGKTNWLDAQNECDWLGVSCEKDTIVELNLDRQSLVGTMPPELSLLTRLASLLLRVNDLTGEVPEEIYQLTAMTALALGQNRINGTVSSRIANLTQLENLSIGRNKLTGSLPKELFDLQGIVGIFGIDNDLSGSIPSSIGDMSLLQFFSMDNNALTGSIPTEVGLCTALLESAVGGNNLDSTIPTEIGLLAKLNSLNVGDSGVKGTIPSELGNCSDMRTITLQLSPLLEGEIPSELGNLSMLSSLELQRTNLNGTMPDEICVLRDLILTTLTSDCIRDVNCSCCTDCS